MTPNRRIALLSPDQALHGQLKLRIESKGYQVVSLPDPAQVFGFIFSDPPDLVIFDLTIPHDTVNRILLDLKQDSYFSVLPTIGIIREADIQTLAWDQVPLDDFVTAPVNYRELFSRIMLCFQRMQRIFDNNPLTKLPGNTSIQHAIERAMGKPMAVCYIDINNFKPYNDTYGFSRGDEVLRMVARIMSNTVKEARGDGFIGHVGGDDFVFIVPTVQAEQICQSIIARFSIIVSDLFSEEDKTRGHYVAKDRKGIDTTIPLLGLAIAVVPTDNPRLTHTGKVAEVAAELKKQAKKSAKSCYIIDRRRS